MGHKHCQQCGEEFRAKRRSAKFCSALCRQHHWRGHSPIVVAGKAQAHVVNEPRVTPQASPTLWEHMEEVLLEARIWRSSSATLGTVVASVVVMDDDEVFMEALTRGSAPPEAGVFVTIVVMDDDGKTLREWELDGEL